MIMTKEENGTYKQVGFIYRNDEIDVSGEVPVDFKTTDGIIGDYKIKGNAYQSEGVSPDTPQEVKAVGDRTANLFDYKKYFESAFTKYNEYFEFAEIQLKPFTTYTFTTSFREYVGSTSVLETAFIITTSTEEPRTLTGGISSTRIATKTTEADGIIKIYKRIRSRILPKKEDFDSGMHWLMVSEGDTALSYEPYGYKIPVVTRGKNLWYLKSSYSFTTFYNINVNIKAGHYLSYIIETNGTTGSQGETGCQLTFSDNTTQYVLFNANYRTSIFLSKDVKIVRVYAGKDYNASAGFTATVSEIMVSANADDSYEPYHEPITTPIYLDSPL